jgi:dihydrofolate reductase
MAKLRAHNIMMSIDGFMAGSDQSLEDPMGVGSDRLKEWVFAPDRSELDSAFIARGDDNIGATLMGRNMFGPVRGPWPDESWRGWWGEEPPYHHPVFVLTHHARAPLPMIGTTFHFVTAGLESGLAQAFAAADGADVRLGGGASTIRQCLAAGLLDELHIAVVPTVLGAGERIFDGLGTLDGYECTEIASSPAVAHMVFTRIR